MAIEHKHIKAIVSISILLLMFIDFDNLLCLHTSWEEKALASLDKVDVEKQSDQDHQYIGFNQLLKTKLDLNDLPPRYPSSLLELDGEEVVALGVMTALDQIQDVQHFLLKNKLESCSYCDEGNVLLGQIYVSLKDGVHAPIVSEVVKVRGELHLLAGETSIDEREGDLKNMSIFSLLNSSVEKATALDKKLYLQKVYSVAKEQ